jgi:hypothetical protein
MATTIEAIKDIIGSCQQEVESLIQGVQIKDPRLYDAILLLNQQVEQLTQQVSPLIRKSKAIAGGVSALPAPINFICFSTRTTVRFTWDQVDFAAQYEVRMGEDWDTAFLQFRTIGLQGDIDALVYGSYTFLIKTLDAEGNYSTDYQTTTIDIPVILAPGITVSVIDNNVLLYWSEPISTFKVDYYLVDKRGDAEASGRVDGTFTSIFEVVAGTYQYAVSAVDIAGNIGLESEVEVFVNTPPDYALQETRISNLMGARVNVLRMSERPSLLCCWAATTWQAHFTNRSWLSPQNQVTAGYPIYIQPSTINGSYEEVFDYGAVLNNLIATVTWNVITYVAFNVDIIVKMAVSNDGITYTPFTLGSSQYFRNLRYLKVRLEFTAENDKAFIELYNLTISLNVKRENDGGEINALSTDAGGTTVNFTKEFKDIESITCTTKSDVEPYIVIFDFNDIPNPTFFKVYVFDTMGARVTKVVDWKARGII